MSFQQPQASQLDIQSIAVALTTGSPTLVTLLDDEYVRLDGTSTMTGDLDVGSNSILDASIDAALIDSGTLPDGRITETGVTQHEAALTITLTQVSEAAAPNAREVLIADGSPGVWGQRALVEADISDLRNYPVLAGSPPTVQNVNISESSVTQHEAALTITESQISDLQSYLVLTGSPLVVPDANIAESSVTQHEAALTITESQISDLGTYLPLSSVVNAGSPVRAQAWDANLDTFAGLTPVDGWVVVGQSGSPADWTTRALVEADISDLQTYAVLTGSPQVVADSVVSQTAVTQHETALSITEGQISDLFTTVAPLASPTFTGVPTLSTYTVGTLPAVGSGGGVIFVSDATRATNGSPATATGAMCFSDGSNWIDVTTGVAVV